MRARRRGRGLFAALLTSALAGMVLLLSRSAMTDTVTVAGQALPAAQRMEDRLSRAAAEALGELAKVKKVYRLGDDVTIGPVPQTDGYLVTEDPARIEALLQSPEALALMGEQSCVWNSSRERKAGTALYAYLDESILVLLWQERMVPSTLTWCEVFIGDASQLRRKLVDDSYGSNVLKAPTELARECNAVLATDGDFYRYRGGWGINVYQGQVFRAAGEYVDTCFFDRGGNMLFSRAGELKGEEEVERFVREHDVITAISFGPVMIENGRNVTPATYPVGEFADSLARCCFGQMGERHYLLCAVDYYMSVNRVAEVMVERGVQSAYNLDGGQSSAIVLLGEQRNPTIFGAERMQSDILWFASAVPD